MVKTVCGKNGDLGKEGSPVKLENWTMLQIRGAIVRFLFLTRGQGFVFPVAMRFNASIGFSFPSRCGSNDTKHDQVRFTGTVGATVHATVPPRTAHVY